MTEKEKLKNILINENAYFFQKKATVQFLQEE